MTGRLHQVFYLFIIFFFFIAINFKCTFGNTYLQLIDIRKNE